MEAPLGAATRSAELPRHPQHPDRTPAQRDSAESPAARVPRWFRGSAAVTRHWPGGPARLQPFSLYPPGSQQVRPRDSASAVRPSIRPARPPEAAEEHDPLRPALNPSAASPSLRPPRGPGPGRVAASSSRLRCPRPPAETLSHSPSFPGRPSRRRRKCSHQNDPVRSGSD